MRYDTHVCLVSDQPIPNLIPILDQATRPSRVFLLVSSDKQPQGGWLKEVMEATGCIVEDSPIDPYSFEGIRSIVDHLLEQLSESHVVLNATGGTKVMALAAFDAFRTKKRPVIYVNTHMRQIMHLFPPQGPVPIADMLTVEAYLKSYGYTILSRGRSDGRRLGAGRIGQALTSDPDGWAGAMKTLNGIAGGAKGSLQGQVTPEKRAVPRFSELVGLFEAEGFVKDGGDRLLFADEQSRLYVVGGWLEEHVFDILQDLKEELGIVDLQGNIHVRKAASGPTNELDVAFTAGNRLHLIECKTGAVDADVAYKLNTLKDVAAGLFGKAMLVSLHGLQVEHKQRCSDLRIGCIDGSSMKQVKEGLIRWVTGR